MLTIDYNQYVTQYQPDKTAAIPEHLFPSYLTKAVCFLENATMGKLHMLAEENRVKCCACQLAELFYKQFLRGGIVREENDGYGVTYDTAFAEKEAVAIATQYLSGTGLLYRGIG